jgi:Dienelactone hydrolase family
MSCLKRAIGWMLVAGFCAWSAYAVEPNLQAPPAVLPADMPHLSNLLIDPQGKPIASKAAWDEERTRLLARWQQVLGEFPKVKPPLKTQVLATEQLPGFSRQWVKYQVEDGLFADGYLLTPEPAKGKLPAVVVFHPTSKLQARGVAGLSPKYPEEEWQGLQLVRRGYVVWCPRNYINTDGTDWAGNTRLVLARHPGWTGMTRMTWDAIRAADFLESLSNTDPGRIGCLGHSLGAKEVLYAMAFDPRYKAGVASECGIGLRFSNWDAPWYLGAKIHDPGFKLEHHELLGLIAPRAFLLLAGDSADNDRSWAFIETARPIYQLLGAPDNIGWFNHHLGHRYAPEARALAESFLSRHLEH